MKESLVLKVLGERVYKKLDKLEIGIIKGKEPFLIDSKTKFETINIGDTWGGLFDCAWFKLEGTIPQYRKSIVLLIDVGGEGLVYDENMNILSGITNKASSYGIPPEKPGKYVIDIKDKKTRDEITFFVDASCNDLMGYVKDGGKITDAYFAEEDQFIKSIYYDLETLIEFSKTNDEIKYFMNSILKLFKTFSLAELKQISSMIKDFYDTCNLDLPINIFSTGHAHLDIAWLWPIREGRRKAMRTFSTALMNMDKYPDYIFGASQFQLFEWIKADNKSLFERIKKKVQEKQFELQGCFWVESDLNIPSGESLIRQIYYGKDFMRKEFGVDVKYLWEPDVFGFTGALPQILLKSGIDVMFSQKLSQNLTNKFPHHSYIWEGIDDSIITCHHFPEDTYDSKVRPQSIQKIAKNYIEKDVFPKALLVYGVGDGGGGPGEEHIERLRRLSRLHEPGTILNSRVEDYAKEIRNNKHKLPKMKGELYFERHRGCYTTEVLNKKGNRNLEYLIHNYLYLCALKQVYTNVETDMSKLHSIWKEVLLYQFHDILPGTSILRVYHETRKRYNQLQNEMKEMNAKEISYLSKIIGTTQKLFILNPSPFEKEEWINFQSQWFLVHAEGYGLGEIIDSTPPEVSITESSIENEFIKVTFNQNGSLSSLYHKKLNKEYIDTNKVKSDVTIYVEKSEMYPSWDFEEGYRLKEKYHPLLTKTVVSANGPYPYINNSYIYKNSSIEIKISLDKDSIKYDVTTDWKDINNTVKIHHPILVRSDQVLCNIQFGNIERPTHERDSIAKAKSEISAHKFIDITDHISGIALLSREKYGFYVKDNALEITVLRSQQKNGSEVGIIDDKDFPENNYGDLVKHTFSYAIYPHDSKNYKKDLMKKAYNFNYDLIVSEKSLGSTLQFNPLFKVTKKNIIIETIKPYEKGNGIIIRLYESLGVVTETEIEINVEYRDIYIVNMLEENPKAIDSSLFKFKPYEIKTLLIRNSKEGLLYNHF